MNLITSRLVTVALVSSLCFLGYNMTHGYAVTSPEYDLTVDNMPIAFDDNKTIYLDTQTNDRAFVIYNNYLQIRSHHITFYDLNISDGHADTNLISGDYCYATILAVNATLDTIRPVNNLGFSTDSGSVTISVMKNTKTLIKLRANSSNNATLNISVYDLIPYEKYKFSVDGNRIEMKKASASGALGFEWDGAWSSHTLTISYEGFIYWNDFAVLLLKLGFILGIGAIMYTILLTRRRSGGRG